VRLFVYGLAALAVAGAVAAAAAVAIRESGREAERARVEEENREFSDAVLEGVRDVRGCADAGGVWSQRTGECRRPLPGPAAR
jgi:hypothetical protein